MASLAPVTRFWSSLVLDEAHLDTVFLPVLKQREPA